MTRRRAAFFGWLFALFLLQNGADSLFPERPFPFLLLGVVFFALQEGPAFGAFLGCLAGIFFEIYGSGPIGFQMFLMAAVGFLCGWVGVKLFRDNFFVQLFLPATVYFVYELSNVLMGRYNSGEPIKASIIFEVVSGLDLFVILAGAPALYWLLRRLSRTRRFSTMDWTL